MNDVVTFLSFLTLIGAAGIMLAMAVKAALDAVMVSGWRVLLVPSASPGIPAEVRHHLRRCFICLFGMGASLSLIGIILLALKLRNMLDATA